MSSRNRKPQRATGAQAAMDVDLKLATARHLARRRFPFYAHAIVEMVPIWLEPGTLGTVGILPNMVTLMDPAFVETLTVAQLEGLLHHEVQHPLRGHPERGIRCGALDPTTGRRDPWWNVAVDLEINDDLVEADVTLPPNGVYPKDFGLEEGRTAEEYYQALKQQAQQHQQSCPMCGGTGEAQQGAQGEPQGGEGQEGAEGQDEGQGDAGDGTDGQGEGSGGSGHGGGSKPCPACQRGLPQRPTAAGGWDGSGGGRALPIEDDIAKELGLGEAGRTPAQVRASQRRMAEAIRDAVEKGRGNVPSGLARWAEEHLRPAKIDWRQKLAQVARNAVAYRPGAVDYSYRRPSRRQAAFGFGPGKPRLPAMVRPVPRVAVAIDTSGSMSARDLGEAVSEADGVMKALGAEVGFIACDAEVGAVMQVRNAQELMQHLVGGGGTDFRPVFKAAAKMRPAPEVVIFATDGYGPAGHAPPAGMRVVWLLIGENATEPSFPDGVEPWGDMVRVSFDRDEEEEEAA